MAAAGHPLRRQGSADPAGGSEVSGEFSTQLRRRHGQGDRLPDRFAESMGEHFGQDFSEVRVHADPSAGAMATSIQAAAFTHGNDIYFAPGAYRPASPDGQRTLAHELSHVAAQRSGADSGGSGPLRVGLAQDPAEAAANRSADRAMAALRRTRTRQGDALDGSGEIALVDAGRPAADRLRLLRRTKAGPGVLRREDDPPSEQQVGGGVAQSDATDRPVVHQAPRAEKRRPRRGRAMDALSLFKQYMAENPAHRKLLDNIPSSKLGRFDAEYDPDAGILAITVRPRFTFTGTWSKAEKSKFMRDFKKQVATKWSGQHDFVCTRGGLESLRARVRVRVAPVATPQGRAHFEVKVQDTKSGDTYIGREQFSDPTQIGTGTFSRPDAPERPHDNMGTRCSLARHDAARIHMFIRANMSVDARGRGIVEFENNTMKPGDAAALAKLVKVLRQTTELGATPLPIIVTKHKKGRSGGTKRAEAVRAVLATNGHYPVRIEAAKDQLATLKAEQKQSHRDYEADKNTGNKPGGYFDRQAQAEIDQHTESLKSTNVTIHPDDKWAASYRESDPYSILAHEFGHMLGNPDEYFGYGQKLFDLKKEQLLATGREGDRQIADAMRVNPETIGERAEAQGAWGELVLRSGQKLPIMTNKGTEVTNSMMNAGAIVMPAHYATIWEALGRITSKAIPGIQEKDWVFEG